MISTVISFSTLELRFFPALISEVKKFSDDIVVVAYDHFFDGSPEDLVSINALIVKYPDVRWEIGQWNPQKDSKYWHNYARWCGTAMVKNRYVLYLDADEIPEGDLMRQYLETEPLGEHALYMFSCYWYFREPQFRATTLEGCGLLADTTQLTEEMFFTIYERWIYLPFPALKSKMYCDLGGKTIMHHYSWVRTKEEMLTKVKSWAHRNDCNWTERVEQEFTHDFNGRDFVHGYSYVRVPNTFNIQLKGADDMPESDPLVRRPAIELITSQVSRLTKPILDIGVGSGFYGRTLRGIYPRAEIYGIDIWPPYITPKHLEWYRAVILTDALAFDYAFFKDRCSLLIAADVVEHFEKEDAVRLVRMWKQFAPWIIITLPIQDFEQGPYMGNSHETHLHQWKVDEVERDLDMKLVKDCGVCGLFQFQM